LQDGEVLNQEIAVRISKDVIRAAGYDPNDFELFPIREEWPPETRYFGTGPAQPPHGYTIWKNRVPKPGQRGLTVSMEVRDRVARCRLSWWH
jgi:hypothetical protein